MLDANKQVTPLKQNISPKQVGNASAFFARIWRQSITGEILHVGGFNTVGMSMTEEAE